MKNSKLCRIIICVLMGVVIFSCGNKVTNNSMTNSKSNIITDPSSADKTISDITLNYINNEEQNLRDKNWDNAQLTLLNLQDSLDALSTAKTKNSPETIARIDELILLVKKLDEQIKNRNEEVCLLTIEQIKTSFSQIAEALKTPLEK